MKINLKVTQGVHQGKVIPVSLSQFLIGRDPQCQLRPASAAISKRHCALLTKGDQVFVRDFDSTNGTFVNEQPVKGEAELHDGDSLKVGPLVFGVEIDVEAPAEETKVAATQPAKAKAGAKAAAGNEEEDDIAAMLLGLQEGDTASANGPGAESIPSGSTVMELPAVTDKDTQEGPAKGKKANTANTSSAAEAILKKYMRRPR